eukprot:TRINITY_DN10759_c0_g1_i1.p1 TRINITY_DN10759_c0_g1~~TRINITY_DN10759_c0_g1_i1.p1  ORF type:complete len:182 (+),score=41.34 TRINITY_DN10759_c0_g1_i1:158-703(+)
MDRKNLVLVFFVSCLVLILALEVVPTLASSSSSRLDWYHSHDDDDDDHLSKGEVYDALKVFDKVYKRLRKVDCHKAQQNVDDAYVALFDLKVDERELNRMLQLKEKSEYRVAQLLEAKHQVQQNRIQTKRAFLDALLQDYKLICGIGPSLKIQKHYTRALDNLEFEFFDSDNYAFSHDDDD